MKQIFWLFVIIQAFSLNAFSQNNLWLKQLGKIKPLVSTEKEVEKLLGKAQDRYADVGVYKTREGLFTVTYSRGVCKSSATPYQIQHGTVIQYSFAPLKEVVFSKLGINVTNWEISETSDGGAPVKTYYNPQIGVNLEVQDNVLSYVDVYPAEKFDYLLCSQFY